MQANKASRNYGHPMDSLLVRERVFGFDINCGRLEETGIFSEGY